MKTKMCSFPSFYSKVSVCLSELLDALGLDMETVMKKRNVYLLTEQMWTDMSTRYDVTFYHFGSQTEGTTTQGLNSDLDSLACFNVANVVDDLEHWKKDRLNLLMEMNEKTAPGYCRLHCLKNNKAEFDAVRNITDSNNLFDGDHTYLKNTYILSLTETICRRENYPFIKKGPSGSGTDKIDFVTAFRYNGRSKSASVLKEFHQWPSQNLREEMVNCDKFVVPVGHRKSETEGAEWRISASMSERKLMFSLNETQLKCYVLLKMLKETLLRPVVEDSVTSYHCKNVLFHVIANTFPAIWQPQNLLACLQLTLLTLLSFLKHRYCPQFFNPTVNLFLGKISRWDYKTLIDLTENAIKNNLRCLMTVRIDELGSHLLQKLSPLTNIRKGLVQWWKSKHGHNKHSKSIDSKAWRNWLALHFIFVTEFARSSGSYIAKYIIQLHEKGFRVASNEPEEHCKLDVVERFTRRVRKIPNSVKLRFKEIVQEENKESSMVHEHFDRRPVYGVKPVSDELDKEVDATSPYARFHRAYFLEI